MSLARWVCALCSVCGTDGPSARLSSDARRDARRAGWRTLPGDVDLCPEHKGTSTADIIRLQTRRIS